MRSTIRRIIREMASTNLKRELIAMGPRVAERTTGINLQDYITVAYNNDIVEYVSDHIPELTNLRKSARNVYDYDGQGPMGGLVLHYVGKHTNKKGNLVLPYVAIPQKKLTYLLAEEKLLTPELLIEFINEFYGLNATKIVKILGTNFG